MTTLLIVRHAQASFGAVDYDCLSARGECQASYLGDWLKQTGFLPQVVATGGLRRHRQTAEHALKALNLDYHLLEFPGFAEFDNREVMERAEPGVVERLKALLQQGVAIGPVFQEAFKKGVGRWISGDYDHDYRQTWPRFRWQVLQSLESLIRTHPEQSILLITSGGPIIAMFQAMTGATDERAFEAGLSLLNCGLTRVQASDQAMRLLSFNSAPHLEIQRDKDLITSI